MSLAFLHKRYLLQYVCLCVSCAYINAKEMGRSPILAGTLSGRYSTRCKCGCHSSWFCNLRSQRQSCCCRWPLQPPWSFWRRRGAAELPTTIWDFPSQSLDRADFDSAQQSCFQVHRIGDGSLDTASSPAQGLQGRDGNPATARVLLESKLHCNRRLKARRYIQLANSCPVVRSRGSMLVWSWLKASVSRLITHGSRGKRS